MRSGGLRRAVAVRVARWVQAWADRVVQEEPADFAPAAPLPTAVERGALEEWVARVRAAAPELLVGLDLPPVGAGPPEARARPEPSSGIDGPFAGGTGALDGAPPGRSRTPTPRLPAPPRRAPGSAQAESPFGMDPPLAGGADTPAELHDGERAAGGGTSSERAAATRPADRGGPRAEPPRVLRFTERAQRTASTSERRRSGPAPQQASGERDEAARTHDGGWPNPPSRDVASHALPSPWPALAANVEGDDTRPDVPGDAPRRGRAALGTHPDGAGAPAPPWNRAPPGDEAAARRASTIDAALASEPPRARIAPPPDLAPWRGADLPDPWPELPPEPPPTDLEDGFLRRLERLHRLAREQWGD